MRYIPLEAAGAAKRTVALGGFDGLHLGHRAVLMRTVQNDGTVPTMLTFRQKPWELPKAADGVLLTDARRDTVLVSLGIEEVVEMDFAAVRGLTPEQFVTAILHDALHATRVVCGFNYRFGAGGAGTADTLKTLCDACGIAVETVAPVEVDGEPVSASRIRETVRRGDLLAASRLLGHAYTLEAPVVRGKGLAHTLGTPTVNQELPERFVCPPYGVYLSSVVAKGRLYTGITNIGVRPTVAGDRPNAETWILGFEGDLYGENLSVSPVKKLRDEQKFDTVEQLREQILRDAEAAKAAVAPTGHPRAVLFDFDDTLQDRLIAFLAYSRRFVAKYLPDLPPDEVERRALEMRERNHGGFVDYNVFFRDLCADWGIDADVSMLKWERNVQFPRHTAPYPGTAAVLRHLREKGLLIGVVTNGPLLQQWRKLDFSGLLPLIDTALVSSEEQVAKPDPEIFLRAAARLGVAPADCVFVGDQVPLDIVGAQSAGMLPVHIDAVGDKPTPEGVIRITAIEQLPQALGLA